MVRLRISPPINALASFHYFRDTDLDRYPNLTIIGDSGAFSAKTQGVTITTKDLADWAKKWRHKLKWVAALDVIGNPVATYSNWREMVDVHGVEAIPTIHYGTHPSELDKYARRGVDLVGLGGMGLPSVPQQMRWLIQVFKYAAAHHPTMQFHGWGCTGAPHLRLPFYSVDSSSWTYGIRYGLLRMYDPETHKMRSVKLRRGEAYLPRNRRVLESYYGTTATSASREDESFRPRLLTLGALSESQRERDFQKRHGPATAPTWGVNHEVADLTCRALHISSTEDSLLWVNNLHD